MESQLGIITGQIKKELSSPEISRALMATTFNGLTEIAMRQAIMEGMMRGFVFKDFLEKNVYAIPFGQKYSLVTSIDYARKLAMRSGLAGKSEPKFVEKDGQIVSCSVTVKRNVDGVVGDYTATVYFDEYTTGRNLWTTKKHTMIAKVAEMHALRSAFPEEMAKNYVEEEIQKETIVVAEEVNVEEHEKKLKKVKNLEELKSVWASIPLQAKEKLKGLKEMLKEEFTPNENPKVSK